MGFKQEEKNIFEKSPEKKDMGLRNRIVRVIGKRNEIPSNESNWFAGTSRSSFGLNIIM